MAFFIGFGKFSKFYWLIVASALIKLIISIFFRLNYMNRESLSNFSNFSLIKDPILNEHIFVYYIYHYLGFFIFGFVFLLRRYLKKANKVDYKKVDNLNDMESFKSSQNKKEKEKEKEGKLLTLIFPNLEKEKENKNKYISTIINISLIYMISEMIIYYFDQKNHNNVCFWMLEIFFIHLFLLLKDKKYKLYKHQILSFAIIIIFGFGIKLISSFFPQCEYITIDVDKQLEEMMKNLTDYCIIFPIDCQKIEQMVREGAEKSQEDSNYRCNNSYNIYLVSGKYLHIFIITAAIGYLISLSLHSYSVVKIRPLIYEKLFSPYSLIFFIGFLGLIFSIIALSISTMIPCGRGKYASEFCHSTSTEYIKKTNETEINNTLNDGFIYLQQILFPLDSINVNENKESEVDIETESTFYFDSILAYFTGLDNNIHQKHKQIKKPVYGYIEILVSIFILPILSFFKANFDFFIIKELGLFHLLLPEVVYQLIKEIIIFILKIITDRIDPTQVTQFIIISISNILTFIGVCIYLELIEIRFCGFDKDIKKNIALRGEKETDQEEGFIDNEVTFGERAFGINDRDSINDYSKENIKEIN